MRNHELWRYNRMKRGEEQGGLALKHRKRRGNGSWILGSVLLTVLLLAGAIVLGKCWEQRQPAAAPAEEAVQGVDAQAEAMVAAMTPEEKIGQMMMIGIRGTTADADSLYLLHAFHFGGIVFFDRNMASAEQVKALTDSLQAQAEEKVPLFFAVDEEGGRVVRMRQELEAPPAQQALAQAGDPAAARSWAAATAKRLQALGIQINFAPVADLSATDTRSYSSDPAVVVDYVRAAADGYEQAHMLYSLKHFPGLDKGVTDTHLDAVQVAADRETLIREDMMPFQAIIQERNPDQYLMMVTHVQYPALDAVYPATLSKAIMTGLLRQELGYQGIIVTDDLDMGAITKHYDLQEAGVQAVLAGADLVLVCHETEHQKLVYQGLLQALQDGRLDMERVDASVRRIVKAKLLYALQ